MQEPDMGSFIRAMRTQRKLTQKQLAEQLGVTDKAVSKWETNNGYPDITLLTPLAEALGVSVTELLNGQLDGEDDVVPGESLMVGTLAYAQQAHRCRHRKLRWWLLAGLTAACLVAALVCWICDTVLTGGLSWSLIVDLCLVQGWVVALPLLLPCRRPVRSLLAVLTVTSLPFLYGLGRILGETLVFRIGLPVAPAALLYLWIIYLLWGRLAGRGWRIAGVICLLSVPLSLLIEVVLFRVLGESSSPGQGIGTVILAVICFGVDWLLRHRPLNQEPF